MTNSDQRPYIAALDVGAKRIGVALAHYQAAIPSPYRTLANDNQIWDTLRQLFDAEGVGVLVIGLPRGLDGQETAQTATVRTFIEELKRHFDLPVYLQDEALTSVQAEAELGQRKTGYNKSLIDAQAAAIILQDYLITRSTHEDH